MYLCIKGINNYKETATVEFEITRRAITLTAGSDEKVYCV